MHREGKTGKKTERWRRGGTKRLEKKLKKGRNDMGSLGERKEMEGKDERARIKASGTV